MILYIYIYIPICIDNIYIYIYIHIYIYIYIIRAPRWRRRAAGQGGRLLAHPGVLAILC